MAKRRNWSKRDYACRGNTRESVNLTNDKGILFQSTLAHDGQVRVLLPVRLWNRWHRGRIRGRGGDGPSSLGAGHFVATNNKVASLTMALVAGESRIERDPTPPTLASHPPLDTASRGGGGGGGELRRGPVWTKILNKRLPSGAPRDAKQLNRMEHNAMGHACIGGAITRANGPRLLTISHRDSPAPRELGPSPPLPRILPRCHRFQRRTGRRTRTWPSWARVD